MYISRVEININNRKRIRDLTHLGAFHNWVEQSFPNEIKNRVRTRKLWRIDRLYGKNYLIVISSEKPDFNLLEYCGVENSAETKSYDKVLDNIANGKRMRFRVVLNPVVAVSSGLNKRGKIKPICNNDEDLKNFLIEKSQKNGFLLNTKEFAIVSKTCETFRKKNEKKVKLIKVTYEGILTVENTEIFRKTLITGIGKKKAYGFGLLTVLPIG